MEPVSRGEERRFEAVALRILFKVHVVQDFLVLVSAGKETSVPVSAGNMPDLQHQLVLAFLHPGRAVCFCCISAD